MRYKAADIIEGCDEGFGVGLLSHFHQHGKASGRFCCEIAHCEMEVHVTRNFNRPLLVPDIENHKYVVI